MLPFGVEQGTFISLANNTENRFCGLPGNLDHAEARGNLNE